jgi:hypothetical protein
MFLLVCINSKLILKKKKWINYYNKFLNNLNKIFF